MEANAARGVLEGAKARALVFSRFGWVGLCARRPEARATVPACSPAGMPITNWQDRLRLRPASYTSTLWRDEFDRASIHVVKDKWRYNLSMRLAADKHGKVRQTAEKYRIDAVTAAAIAEYCFDEVDWFGLTYEVR
jgi:hypothetical protein